MTIFLDFLGDMTGWDWVIVTAASWTITAVLVAPWIGRAMRDEDIRQPDARDWYCSDGRWRTEAEAADWAAEEDESDAAWLDAWPTGEDIPDYVPQEWVA